jgi:hypothetical protein
VLLLSLVVAVTVIKVVWVETVVDETVVDDTVVSALSIRTKHSTSSLFPPAELIAALWR